MSEEVVEEFAPMEESVSAEEPIPVEEPISVEEPVPTEEPVSAEEPVPVEESASVEESIPAEGSAPVREACPSPNSVSIPCAEESQGYFKKASALSEEAPEQTIKEESAPRGQFFGSYGTVRPPVEPTPRQSMYHPAEPEQGRRYPGAPSAYANPYAGQMPYGQGTYTATPQYAQPRTQYANPYPPVQPAGGDIPYRQAGEYGQPGSYAQAQGYTRPQAYARQGESYPYGGATYHPQAPYSRTYATPQSREEAKKDKKNKSFNWMLVLLITGCVLMGCVCGLLIGRLTGDKGEVSLQGSGQTQAPTGGRQQEPIPTMTTANTVPRETAPLATSSGEMLTLGQIYSENVPAIVSISSYVSQNVYGQTSESENAGSGFIISADGEILTNYHVVEGASRLVVSLYDGREYPATLVGYEAENDVALIRIEAENLPVCAIGNSDGLYVGEQVAAIGNPMGELSYTMTVGYVSALNRFITTDGNPINMIQVDAAINPGNSGGPIFNIYGEVIGIATAKYSGTLSGGATLEGLGFAIPINDVIDILPDLRTNGRVVDRAYMGVVVSTLPVDAATYGIGTGVLVQSVEEGGSAYKAGIQANDIILKIGDVELSAYENLVQALKDYRAGDKTTATIYRGGQTLELEIVFDAKPEVLPQVTEPTETVDPWSGGFPWGE